MVSEKCPNNPNGDWHELDSKAMPYTEEWFKLTMQEKIRSQFCKWCHRGIW